MMAILNDKKTLGILFLAKNAKYVGFMYPSEKRQHQQHFAGYAMALSRLSEQCDD